MKLTKIRKVGRFINPETGNPVNVKTGKRQGRSVDILYYTFRGKRVFINDRDFYNDWKRT